MSYFCRFRKFVSELKTRPEKEGLYHLAVRICGYLKDSQALHHRKRLIEPNCTDERRLQLLATYYDQSNLVTKLEVAEDCFKVFLETHATSILDSDIFIAAADLHDYQLRRDMISASEIFSALVHSEFDISEEFHPGVMFLVGLEKYLAREMTQFMSILSIRSNLFGVAMACYMDGDDFSDIIFSSVMIDAYVRSGQATSSSLIHTLLMLPLRSSGFYLRLQALDSLEISCNSDFSSFLAFKNKWLGKLLPCMEEILLIERIKESILEEYHSTDQLINAMCEDGEVDYSLDMFDQIYTSCGCVAKVLHPAQLFHDYGLMYGLPCEIHSDRHYLDPDPLTLLLPNVSRLPSNELIFSSLSQISSFRVGYGMSLLNKENLWFCIVAVSHESLNDLNYWLLSYSSCKYTLTKLSRVYIPDRSTSFSDPFLGKFNVSFIFPILSELFLEKMTGPALTANFKLCLYVGPSGSYFPTAYRGTLLEDEYDFLPFSTSHDIDITQHWKDLSSWHTEYVYDDQSTVISLASTFFYGDDVLSSFPLTRIESLREFLLESEDNSVDFIAATILRLLSVNKMSKFWIIPATYYKLPPCSYTRIPYPFPVFVWVGSTKYHFNRDGQFLVKLKELRDYFDFDLYYDKVLEGWSDYYVEFV